MTRVAISEILIFLNPEITSRVISAGEHVMNTDHIRKCGILQKNNLSLTIFALFLQTSALTNIPHEVKVYIKSGNDKLKDQDAECACTTGKSIRYRCILCGQIKTPVGNLSK